MSLCINPRCLQPDHSGNDNSLFCQSCGSDLVLQRKYRVMRLLSDTSGFGKVYEAYERSTPKILKVLKETHSHNAKAVELFQQEAIVLQQLKHPGVPTIEPDGYFQFLPRNSAEPLHCIIMEKIDGPTLMQWMQQQGGHPISEKQALNWLHQLAEVLHLVHQKNYFHRDIKPQNIMIRPSGQLVLIDFGAAREMTYSYLAQVGGAGNVTKISSAGYTPPEQEKGQALPQSDFYALGRTFVYLLTGKQLTDSGIYDAMTDTFHWRSYAPQLSPKFIEFIDKLIAYRAADRPKSTQEILDRVVSLEQGLDQELDTTLLQSARARRTPRFRWLMGGMAAVAIVAAGYGIWQFRSILSAPRGQEAIVVLKTLSGHSSFVNAIVFSPDGKTLISASADKTIKIWDLATGNIVRTLSGHSSFVNALAVSPDGETLVSGGADKTIKIWNIFSGRELHTLTGHGSFVNALAISTDGQTLASAGADRIIRLWSLPTGKPLHSLPGHSGFVNALVFSSDGQMLASGSADKTIKTWSVLTGQELRTLTGHSGFVNALVFTSDGQKLVSGSADKTIKVWDVSTGNEIRTLIGHTNYVNALAISPDGEALISGSADKTLKLWDLTSGKVTHTLTGYRYPINYFAVSGWQTIATGSGSQTISVWQVPR